MSVQSKSGISKRARVLAAMWLMVTTADAATLTELFDREDYAAFQSRAQAAAAQGDAEALFLLGKAAHLGKGREVDLAEATARYEAARAKGSARASNNLGSILLEQGDREGSIPLFEEALARGLKMPTLINLGRAYTPPDPTNFLNIHSYSVQARKAGDHFAAAFAIQPDFETSVEAAREYLRAYLIGVKALGDDSALDLPAVRALAVQWLKRGMAVDHGPSWTNYGALLLDENDYAGARTALEKGAAQRVPTAMFHLGNMAQDGQGLAAPDRELALQYFEQAALLGLAEARHPAIQLLEKSIEYSTDAAKLEQGIARLNALRKPEDFAPLHPPEERLAWLRYIETSQREAAPTPKLPIRFEACELGINGSYGLEYNITENTEWRLVAYQKFGEAQELGIEGRVTDQGCATIAKPLPENVRALLDVGAVLAIWFPNYTLPLRWAADGKAVWLRMLPLGTAPIPGF